MSTKELQIKLRDYGLILGTLMFIDYLLTYWGITLLRFTTELNPLMTKFMRLPLQQGISLRIVFILIPLVLLKLAFMWSEKKHKICTVMKVLACLQILPISFHFIWIFQYLVFLNS